MTKLYFDESVAVAISEGLKRRGIVVSARRRGFQKPYRIFVSDRNMKKTLFAFSLAFVFLIGGALSVPRPWGLQTLAEVLQIK